MQYALVTTAYGSPVFVAKDYGWTDNPNRALTWQEPDVKALESHNRIMKEEFKYQPVNESK